MDFWASTGRLCTANAHLLSHLPKYVCLWGLLWTHLAFGIENKNGHLKHIHGRGDVPQLIYNVCSCIPHFAVGTLQLAQCESEKTITF